MPMEVLNRIISRKFKYIAEDRYEQIAKRYREFLLLPEELVLPEVKSILFPVDRFSLKVPGELFEALRAYAGATVHLLYISEERTLRLIEQTLGKEEAEKLREEKVRFAGETLRSLAPQLEELSLSVETDHIIGSKSDDVIELMSTGRFDLLVISRCFGSEPSKTSPMSPIVFKIIQHIDEPVIVY
ncbi:universal stress protein [Thermococcus sp. AM4]|uniref:universal stress protein n=1 Tax=Thermococcus sp. (strain AM4) TaxID=246969 RepID=UPI001ED8C701|nr:universal stress protein [Thermococcus sp. AM4]